MQRLRATGRDRAGLIFVRLFVRHPSISPLFSMVFAGSKPVSRTIFEYLTGRDTPRQIATFPFYLQAFCRFSHSQALR